ncbi:dihydroxyacetone kinase subunit DhaK [Pelagibius litoralis]|uniref:Dihydroxyacetone kinase subunit DhaK n=1 Tax=Pelagibius litoralis TaxID=374515 RepID=A0A967KGJ0_9PROT|nr:dihydroxyacetone kinase subunit DhaK [Pelagibius litoralis]NIA70396.1 dihydroxyacetone kinase subunit DhaK [Pelagibius litoralis]
MCRASPEAFAVDGKTVRILRRTWATEGKVGVFSGGKYYHNLVSRAMWSALPRLPRSICRAYFT